MCRVQHADELTWRREWAAAPGKGVSPSLRMLKSAFALRSDLQRWKTRQWVTGLRCTRMPLATKTDREICFIESSHEHPSPIFMAKCPSRINKTECPSFLITDEMSKTSTQRLGFSANQVIRTFFIPPRMCAMALAPLTVHASRVSHNGTVISAKLKINYLILRWLY